MRNRIFVIWAALRWVLLMFVLASTLHAPLVVALPKQPVLPLRVWKGTASWYGSRFHGRRTANGETYDMYAYTAAHPTLPFGSLVRLVNPRTGRSQLVRINRSEEHTSELQSLAYLVCRLLLEKKKK